MRRSVARLVWFLLPLLGAATSSLGVACGLSITGGATDLDASSSLPKDSSTNLESDTSSSDATDDSSSTVLDDGATVVVDADADAGPPPPPPTDCKTLLQKDPTKLLKNGVYDIDPDGIDAGSSPFRVYCELTLDDGGWTLVGRSAPVPQASTPSFGWKNATGDVNDVTKPYSLDVVSAKLTFSEVMLADRDSASPHPKARAYKFAADPTFITTYPNSSVLTVKVTSIAGDCVPPAPGPSMFKYTGYTSLGDSFWLRDVSNMSGPTDHYGLRYNRFELAYTNCNQGALLHNLQGLIFVR